MKKINIAPWFERKFGPVNTNLFPVILERLEGTPARMRVKLLDLPNSVLTQKKEDEWSILEQIGHLADLEPLWIGRVGDLTQNKEYLRDADLTNQKTHKANHNSRSIGELILEFENYRKQLINNLRVLKESDIQITALHPRLKTPMTVVDLMYFVAEHDDHHLAFCTALIEQCQ